LDCVRGFASEGPYAASIDPSQRLPERGALLVRLCDNFIALRVCCRVVSAVEKGERCDDLRIHQRGGLADLARIFERVVGCGDYEQVKADIKQALRLSPRDAQIGLYGRADLGLGRYADAIDEEHRAIDDGFTTYWPHEVLTAAYALSGQDKEARAELAETTRLNPKITSIMSLTPLDAGIPRLVEGLRKAGLPED
jgi:tetratricopeptide (TPR) repeat protein